MTRYLWFSAFAICGIAFYVWIETWAQAHRQAMERLLEEAEESRAFTALSEASFAEDWDNPIEGYSDSTAWPPSITVPNDNGTSITHTTT
jgi:hypothetical protein